MANKNCKKLKKAIFFLPVSLLFFSCVSAPPGTETFYKGRGGFGLMAEGAAVYLTAEVRSARPILDSLELGGMGGNEIKMFLDMSDILTAAIFQTPGKRHFYAAASGSFPSAGGGLFFSASKDWEKRISEAGMPYWYSQRSQLAVSMGAKAAYISDGDPFVAAPGARVPEALPAMQSNAVLSGWINDPSRAINNLIAVFNVPVEIPAEKLLFAVYPADGEYSAVLRFETPSAIQAAGLVMIFSMARTGLASADFSRYKDMEPLIRALFSQNPRADGKALIIKTDSMSGKDIALLFNTISVN